MSHQEKIERINAMLNTAETWQQRWQIEREANERLGKQASLVRSGVQSLRARAVQRYADNQRYASEVRGAGEAKRADVYDRLCIVQSGMVRALDDVLELLDHVDRAE